METEKKDNDGDDVSHRDGERCIDIEKYDDDHDTETWGKMVYDCDDADDDADDDGEYKNRMETEKKANDLTNNA